VKCFGQQALKAPDNHDCRLKYLVPNPGLVSPMISPHDAGRSAIYVLRPARPCRDNLGANPLSQRAVPETKGAVSAACGLLPQERRDNQMMAQRGKKTESVKRHHTAKRMILILPSCARFGRNHSPVGRRAPTLVCLSGEWEIPVLQIHRFWDKILKEQTTFSVM